MARRFASSTEQEIEKLLKQKDSENKRRLTKIAKELFHEYRKEKSVQKPEECIIKQLLDSVFAISGVIKVSVSVISLSLRLRLITVTSTLIIPDIAKPHPIIVYNTPLK